MIRITHKKIEGFKPVWAKFRGFSLLFDNPGNSLISMDHNLAQICCSPSSSETDPLELYWALEQSLEEIGGHLLTTNYLFCPLPSSSYHLTVLDGINDGNISNISVKYRPEIIKFIDRIPNSISRIFSSWAKPIQNSRLLTCVFPRITFRFYKLEIWDQQVLIARLIPQENLVKSLKLIELSRYDLAEILLKEFKIKSFPEYSPHISLGYFANQEDAQKAIPWLSNWNNNFARNLAGKTISFSTISLYAFTDMSTYFKNQDSDVRLRDKKRRDSIIDTRRQRLLREIND